jgi:hypothetical protein
MGMKERRKWGIKERMKGRMKGRQLDQRTDSLFV